MIIPTSDTGPAVMAIRGALNDAEIAPEDIDYVNAHATSTPVGDRLESLGMRQALGSAVARIPVSSTKSMTGHLLSAAAAVEAVACLVSLERQVVPPTINLDNPDIEQGCDLDYVPHEAREMNVDVAISNSFGFGGHNASLIVSRV